MSQYGFNDLIEIMAKLRAPNGCPWDREQTHESILNCLIEESYEFIDAVHKSDLSNMKEELGDLLLQIVFHSQMANESGKFSIQDVIQELAEKLVRRHPHVFGNLALTDADQVNKQWELIKKQEKPEREESSKMDKIPPGLAPLLKAQKAQKQAAKIGFDWKDETGPMSKLQEEIEEIQELIDQKGSEKLQNEIGDLLFSAVNLARHLNVDPHQALVQSNLKFENRFRAMEKMAKENRTDFAKMSLKEKEKLWQKAKKDY